jgi:hypothetical protein
MDPTRGFDLSEIPGTPAYATKQRKIKKERKEKKQQQKLQRLEQHADVSSAKQETPNDPPPKQGFKLVIAPKIAPVTPSPAPTPKPIPAPTPEKTKKIETPKEKEIKVIPPPMETKTTEPPKSILKKPSPTRSGTIQKKVTIIAESVSSSEEESESSESEEHVPPTKTPLPSQGTPNSSVSQKPDPVPTSTTSTSNHTLAAVNAAHWTKPYLEKAKNMAVDSVFSAGKYLLWMGLFAGVGVLQAVILPKPMGGNPRAGASVAPSPRPISKGTTPPTNNDNVPGLDDFY